MIENTITEKIIGCGMEVQKQLGFGVNVPSVFLCALCGEKGFNHGGHREARRKNSVR